MNRADVASLRASLTLMARRLRSESRNDGTSWSRMLIIGLIDRLGGTVTPTMLAEAERISSAHVAALLRELEADGLIVRVPNQLDRRSVQISLSEQGLETLQRSRVAREKWLTQAITETLTDAEQERLLTASALIERLARFRS